jgi:hypothetical protein
MGHDEASGECVDQCDEDGTGPASQRLECISWTWPNKLGVVSSAECGVDSFIHRYKAVTGKSAEASEVTTSRQSTAISTIFRVVSPAQACD